MKTEITPNKLHTYFSLTREALEKVKDAPKDLERMEQVHDFQDMAQRYYDDAIYFYKRGDYVTAFAAVNYAHGWLDAGARIGLFKVTDVRLFSVDAQDSKES